MMRNAWELSFLTNRPSSAFSKNRSIFQRFFAIVHGMTHDDIKQLAHLARVEVTDTEVEGYMKDFDAILGYVNQINEVNLAEVQPAHLQENVARADAHPHAAGQSVEQMLADAPGSQDGFYKVPKIL